MAKYIEPMYFLVSLFVGIFFVYIFSPTPDIIIKYPLPEESDNIIYQDDTDTCYKYIAQEVNCDKKDIKKFDVNYVDNNKKNNNNLIDMIMEKI